MSDMRLIVAGAGGRMGRTLVKAIAQTDGVCLVGAAEPEGSLLVGEDSGVLAGLPPNRVPVVSDVRALLMHFRTRTDGDDLLPALQQTLQKFRLQSGLQAELAVDGHGAPLPADVQVQLLHVVQEALSNVRKHAQARQVQVHLAHQPHWQIEIRDDGCGFDAEAGAPDDSV